MGAFLVRGRTDEKHKKAGRKMSDNKLKQVMKKSKNEIAPEEAYAMIPRKILSGLNDGKINSFELLILLWLHIKAEYVTGTVDTSYDAIVSALALSGSGQRNKVTKAMHSLKKNGYVYFPKHQGRRGNVTVAIHQYRLTPTTEKDISHHFTDGKNRSEVKDVNDLSIGEARGSTKSDKRVPDNKHSEQKYGLVNCVEREDCEIERWVDKLMESGEKIRKKDFYNEDEERGYVKEMLGENIKPGKIRETLIDLTHSDWWTEKNLIPSFKDVSKHLSKQRH